MLDLGLPDLDGLQVLEGLRGWTNVPVLVRSARQEQAEQVAALDAGADDDVSKPFGLDELRARLRRRYGVPPRPPATCRSWRPRTSPWIWRSAG